MDAGVIALVVAIITLISAIIRFAAGLKSQLNEIHLLVNSRLDESLTEINSQGDRIEQLIDALDDAEVDVPAQRGHREVRRTQNGK